MTPTLQSRQASKIVDPLTGKSGPSKRQKAKQQATDTPNSEEDNADNNENDSEQIPGEDVIDTENQAVIDLQRLELRRLQ